MILALFGVTMVEASVTVAQYEACKHRVGIGGAAPLSSARKSRKIDTASSAWPDTEMHGLSPGDFARARVEWCGGGEQRAV